VYSNMCDCELNAFLTPIPSQSRLTELQEQPVVPLYDPSRDALDAAITESGTAQCSADCYAISEARYVAA
jgi:hypothetical protein